jgi:hypothetical protein
MKFTELSDSEILDIVKPLADHTEGSWNQKDYDSFCRYLFEDPEHKFTEENFNKQIDENYDTYGNHTVTEFVTLHRNPDNIIIIWKVDFEKRNEPGLLMYKFKEHNNQVLIEGCTYQA